MAQVNKYFLRLLINKSMLILGGIDLHISPYSVLCLNKEFIEVVIIKGCWVHKSHDHRKLWKAATTCVKHSRCGKARTRSKLPSRTPPGKKSTSEV